MPYGTVNLLHGVNPGETPVTCTAGIGTFIVEFATLSYLTGDTVFEDVARRALKTLWKNRSDIGLVSNPNRRFYLNQDLILKNYNDILKMMFKELQVNCLYCILSLQ